jgi:2-polyprenyl-6-hydroxyphenyl methylase/3-demethylubiquinone-9 3-methyltransferase
LREDGNRTFIRELLPRAYERGNTVYDLGGGSRPCLGRDEKDRLGLHVVGLDISQEELAAAPDGVYDRTIAADLCTYDGSGDADAVVCQATLEHVADAAGAMRAIAAIAKPGGRVFVFAPSRNALFARLNMMLPESMKRQILFFVFPHKAAGHDGFSAHYDQCTPRRIEALARASGLEVEERHLFWTSSYFMPFTPAYVFWRLCQLAAWLVLRSEAAETFAYVFRKPTDASGVRPSGVAHRERHVA